MSENKKQSFRKSLRYRYTIYFFVTMLIAGVISLALVYLFMTTRVGTALEKSRQQLVDALSAAVDESEVLSEAAQTGYEVYDVMKLSESDPTVLKYKDRLDAGEVILLRRWLLPDASTYFAVNGAYYEISMFPPSSLSAQLLISLFATVAAALVLGTLLSAFMGKRFLKPIRALSKATAELSKGNFSVRVKAEADDSEIGRLISDFNQMAKDLGGIETLQKEFTSDFSHEFKSPLASINGFARLLCENELSEEDRREYAEIIVEESERLSEMSSNVLRLTKLDNINSIVEKKRFSLDEQLRRVLSTLEPQWSKKRISVEFELDEVELYSSEELLPEVWLNLLGNAIKYTDTDGRISVRLYETLDHAVVEFEDDGAGMSEEVQKRIFDKFYQGDRSHSSEGNGLGLPLAKRIIALCGGNISVESMPDVGSLFRVRLPIDE